MKLLNLFILWIWPIVMPKSGGIEAALFRLIVVMVTVLSVVVGTCFGCWLFIR